MANDASERKRYNPEKVCCRENGNGDKEYDEEKDDGKHEREEASGKEDRFARFGGRG